MGCGCKKKKEEPVQQPVPQTPEEQLSMELNEHIKKLAIEIKEQISKEDGTSQS